jgi:predicted nuclease of restriction endonuclease-like (RecB) superfamily
VKLSEILGLQKWTQMSRVERQLTERRERHKEGGAINELKSLIGSLAHKFSFINKSSFALLNASHFRLQFILILQCLLLRVLV